MKSTFQVLQKDAGGCGIQVDRAYENNENFVVKILKSN